MSASDIEGCAQELAKEYGAAATWIAADRAEFAAGRRDFKRQEFWDGVYALLRRTPALQDGQACPDAVTR